MRAVIMFTPTEAKKFIAKAVARMDIVRNALERGVVVMHPSSSTIFIAEEILGEIPATEVWVCGTIVPKALCGSLTARTAIRQRPAIFRKDPGTFPFSWVIRQGKLETGETLNQLFEEMTATDCYIKGVNALDVAGNVGVLIGNEVEGGTIGRVLAASRRKGFSVIYPVGLEKLIAVPIQEAARELRKPELGYSMGTACSLLPCPGISVTEVKAVEVLSGAKATPVAAGGLAGAEGATVLVVSGEPEQVERAVQFAEESKGAALPELRQDDCELCDRTCSLRGGTKPWVSKGTAPPH